MERPACLPPLARLRSATDFAALRGASGRMDTLYFLIRYRHNGSATARLGLAISRRVSKSAVQRNRIKRVARESFRRARKGMPTWDMLVIARTRAADVENAALRVDLERAWLRLQALRQEPAPGTITN